MKNINLTPEWQALSEHFDEIANVHLRDLFQDDPKRFNTLSLNACGILLDYSKNRITPKTQDLLAQLADAAKLKEHIQTLFSGGKINTTEHRPALHTALRQQDDTPIIVDNENIIPGIKKTLATMDRLCHVIFEGTWTGFTQKPITDVVNIGIGGSDLGPKMVVEALKPYHLGNVNCHFVSNLDGADIATTLAKLKADTTLFIISSKSFFTLETLINANTAKKWLLQRGVTTKNLSKHLLAVTANPEKALAFGIPTENILPIGDWVGGRYSLWSAMGLSIALAIGMDNFTALLTGAHSMDEHFHHAPFHENMPVLLAMLGIWNINFFHYPTHAIMPYNEYLKYFVPHLQQLDMESNGKQINYHHKPVTFETGPVIWGQIGTHGQHAFHQSLHQGTQTIPTDFIIPINTHHPDNRHQTLLFASALAQTQALMQGKTVTEAKEALLKNGMDEKQADELAVHQALLGNKPSNTLLLDKVTPQTLGALIALYEHKVFVQSVIWQINAFDQWGVELGKQLTAPIIDALQGIDGVPLDASTQGLIHHYMRRKTQ